MCGLKCRQPCAKPAGATTRCSFEAMVSSSAISRPKTLNEARAGMATREVNERWQREMGDFFVQPDGTLPDRAMQPFEEVFHL